MGLVLRKNFVLISPDNSLRFTIVKTYPNGQRIVLCQQDRKRPKKPFVHKVNAALKGIPWSAYKSELADFANDARFLDIKSDHKKLVVERRKWISPIVDDKVQEELFFQGLLKKADLKEIAAINKINVSTLYRNLGRYYAFGQFDNALLPFFNLIVADRRIPIDHIEAAQLFPRGVGAKPESFDPYRRRYNLVDVDSVAIFAKNILPGFEDKRWIALQARYNAEYALEERVENGMRSYVEKPHRFLSLSQFTRLLNIEVSQSKMEMLREGSKAFRNNSQVITGAATDMAVAPTSRYEIDATILDVYVISKLTKKQIKVVGRPVLYVVTDTASTLIVGYYLSLNTQKWESVIFALFNAMTDKVDHCARYGVHITSKDWPSFHLCNELIIDNGSEYTLAGIAQVIEQRLILLGVDVAEAYMGKSKGTGEVLFSILMGHNIKSLKGSVHKDRAKAKSHPSTNAIFTVDDINEILIKGIIMYNATAEVPNKVTQEALACGVEPTPIQVFNWGIKHLLDGGMTLPASDIMTRLLPRQKATVSKKGIFLSINKKRLRYVEEDEQFRKWREEKSQTGNAEIEVIVLPTSTSCIWYTGTVTDNRLIKLPIMSQQERLDNLHLEEALEALKSESTFASKNRRHKALFRAVLAAEAERMTKANMQLLKNVQKIGGKSMPNDVKENREIDLALEMVEMSIDVQSIMDEAIKDSSDPEYRGENQ